MLVPTQVENLVEVGVELGKMITTFPTVWMFLTPSLNISDFPTSNVAYMSPALISFHKDKPFYLVLRINFQSSVYCCAYHTIFRWHLLLTTPLTLWSQPPRMWMIPLLRRSLTLPRLIFPSWKLVPKWYLNLQWLTQTLCLNHSSVHIHLGGKIIVVLWPFFPGLILTLGNWKRNLNLRPFSPTKTLMN